MTALALAGRGWKTFLFTDGPVPAELGDDLGVDLSLLTLVELGADRPGRRRGRELQRLSTLRRHSAGIRAFDLDLFVNTKYKSQLPGCGDRNIYYCHFPHRLVPEATNLRRRVYLGALRAVERAVIDRDPRGFLATYDAIWANSEFTATHVAQRWSRQAQVVHPPCEQVPALDKRREIAVIGRFQEPGPGAPYKAQDFLVDTFAGMTDLHRAGWRLVLAGAVRPEDEGYLARVRRAAEGAPIDLRTNLPRTDMRGVIGRAGLYWHAQGVGQDSVRDPETQEHFGISTVEAMSAGAIPLVYGTAGPLEVVRGVQGVQPWRNRNELEELTRRWTSGIDDRTAEVDHVRERCRRRATEFDPAHFAQRLGEVL
jgi:glycosyltransferase involved in cell wall biosynthesis